MASNLKSHLSLLIKNPYLRLDLSLVFGVIMNFIYVGANFIFFLSGAGAWPLSVSVYYLLLISVRIFIFGYRELENSGTENNALLYRVCLRAGFFMLFFDLVATALALWVVFSYREEKITGFYLAVLFLYSAYSIFLAVRGLVRAARQANPLSFAARNLRLAEALISVFNLSYSLYPYLGIGGSESVRLNAFVCIFVFSVLLISALALVVKCKRALLGTLKKYR